MLLAFETLGVVCMLYSVRVRARIPVVHSRSKKCATNAPQTHDSWVSIVASLLAYTTVLRTRRKNTIPAPSVLVYYKEDTSCCKPHNFCVFPAHFVKRLSRSLFRSHRLRLDEGIRALELHLYLCDCGRDEIGRVTLVRSDSLHHILKCLLKHRGWPPWPPLANPISVILLFVPLHLCTYQLPARDSSSSSRWPTGGARPTCPKAAPSWHGQLYAVETLKNALHRIL